MDILLIEDNPGDIRLLEEVFAAERVDVSLHVVSDGDAALDFAHRRGEHADAPRPDLVLLDWNLPRVDGPDVLTEFKDVGCVPVLVLTGSDAAREIREAYDRHANAVITKPVDPDAFADLVRSIERFWLTLARLPTGVDEEEAN